MTTTEKIRLVHSKSYNTDLALYGVDKPFALDRGEQVLAKLQADCGEAMAVLSPDPVSDADILLVHTKEYLESLAKTATWLEIFEFKGNEYQPELAVKPLTDLLEDIRLKCGGTKLACELALETKLSANLGGGYHHAFAERGRGYCVLHDIAIAIRHLIETGRIKRAMVVDLDFHQGDGTARIFQSDSDVFTLSVHSKEGWPEDKQLSDLDVEIAENETDTYLTRTRQALHQAIENFHPDLVVYVAGSDPYEKDVLPGSRFIKLSLATMLERDRMVIDFFYDRDIPLSMVFAGGYGPHVWEVHYGAVKHLLIKAGDHRLLSGFTQTPK